MRRRQLADLLIQLGFWSQVVLLALVDWGSLAHVRRHGATFGWYVTFAAVNVVLLAAAFLTWRYLTRAQRAAPPS